jgi:hypothetical protein
MKLAGLDVGTDDKSAAAQLSRFSDGEQAA